VQCGKYISYLLILFTTVLSAGASARLLESLKPEQDRAVYDYAHVISANEVQQVESIARELRQNTGAAVEDRSAY